MAVTHVLFLSGGQHHNPVSGAEHHVITLLRELASRGVDTELIVLLWNPDPRIDAVLESLRAAGVRVCVIQRRRGGASFLSRLVRGLDCWRRLSIVLRHNPDRVLHLHLDLVMQVIAARIAGCRRIVFTIHNDEPHYRHPVVKAWFGRLATWGVRFVAITDHVKRYLVTAAGVRPEAITVIKYGVPAPIRHEVPRAAFGLSDSDFVVGFVGRLTPQKNVPLLIRAMARRPDIVCVIVGQGPLRFELEQLTRTLGCRNVRFLGARDNAADLMPLFDVLCLPSVWEGLGLVLVEAMLRDVPIVASRAGAIEEVIDEGRCGLLIDPSSVDSLTAAIDAIRTDRAATQMRVQAARAHVARAYTIRRMGDETCQLYRELMPDATARSEAAA